MQMCITIDGSNYDVTFHVNTLPVATTIIINLPPSFFLSMLDISPLFFLLEAYLFAKNQKKVFAIQNRPYIVVMCFAQLLQTKNF